MNTITSGYEHDCPLFLMDKISHHVYRKSGKNVIIVSGKDKSRRDRGYELSRGNKEA